MSGDRPILDHVVVNARDALEGASALFGRLGFALTAPSRHTLGSINRTAVFARDYLELVGIDREATVPRADLLRSPLGLEGLVFATSDARRLYRALEDKGAPVAPPIEFARPVALGAGTEEARFRVVRVTGVPFGRCYFCQHLTPGLVWRPEWRHHPNGAQAIRRVVIAARDPNALAALFAHLFDGAMSAAVDGFVLPMGAARLEIVGTHAKDAIAELELGVRSLDETRRALEAGGVDAPLDAGLIVVPPEAALGASLAFVED